MSDSRDTAAATLRRAHERIERLAERAGRDGLADFVIFVGDPGPERLLVVELLARPDAIGIAAADTPEIVPELAATPPADLPVTVVVTGPDVGTVVFDCATPGRPEAARPRRRTEARR